MSFSKSRVDDKNFQDHRRTQYQQISFQTRQNLISMVLEQGFSIYRAAKILNINNSTAKVIVRRFRQTGQIFCRKVKKIDQKMIQQKNEEQLGQTVQVNRPGEINSVINPTLIVYYHSFQMPGAGQLFEFCNNTFMF